MTDTCELTKRINHSQSEVAEWLIKAVSDTNIDELQRETESQRHTLTHRKLRHLSK